MANAEVLYGLSRKWWNLYTGSPEYTPPSSSHIHTTSSVEMTLFPINQPPDWNLEWSIQIESDSKPNLVDYIILDSEQWRKFCKWYNGGPALKPKSIQGLPFQYDGGKIRYNGHLDGLHFQQVGDPFRLKEGGGIRSTEILQKLFCSSSGDVIPMKVCTEGIWPDDVMNALPNLCEFEYDEIMDDARMGGGGGGRRCERRCEVAMENVGGVDLAVGIMNLGATCYMNASFQFLLRPLTEGHYNRVREEAQRSQNAVLLQEFVEVWRLLLTNNSEKSRGPGADGKAQPIELTDELIPTLRREWAVKNGGRGDFDVARTEDSQEFLQFIFQKILNHHCSEFCMQTFGILDSLTLQCHNCDKTDLLHQNPYHGLVWMLGLPFPHHHHNTEPTDFTLDQLLRHRSEGNRIENRVCTNCGRADNMWSFSNLYSTSEFLIMYFARAILDEDRLNHRMTDIPEDLDMRGFFRADRVDERAHYKLCGVMDHYMAGRVGHFVATVALNTETRPLKWFVFNDDVVAMAKDFSIKSENVYMLMYKRK